MSAIRNEHLQSEIDDMERRLSEMRNLLETRRREEAELECKFVSMLKREVELRNNTDTQV